MSFNEENPHNEIIDDTQDHQYRKKFKNAIKKIKFVNLLFKNKENSSYDNTNDVTNKKEDYRIAICQDGKFVVTFDTGKLL
jgi:hypothetical protein